MLTIWRISVNYAGLDFEKERKPFEFYLATSAPSQKSALKLAKKQYSVTWWEEHYISGIVEIGKLKAVEDLNVPKDDDDIY